MPEQRMDKTKVRIISIQEEDNEWMNYWFDCTPAECIQHLEDIRYEFNNWKNESAPRLQRVYRIIKQK